jgi:hypothetical protein
MTALPDLRRNSTQTDVSKRCTSASSASLLPERVYGEVQVDGAGRVGQLLEGP